MTKLTLGPGGRGGIASGTDAGANERMRVAWHEGGHAAMAVNLGDRLRVVSIKPRLRWRGVCFRQQEKLSMKALDGLTAGPLATQPVELRVRVERSILVSLAGPAAEDVYFQLVGFTGCRRLDEHDRTAALGLVRRLALSSEERELLARGDCSETVTKSDYSRALTAARALVGEEESDLFVAWLEASARRIVRTPGFIRRAQALAEALFEHEEISGEAAVEIIENVSRYQKGAR